MAAPLTASPSCGLKIGELARRSGLPVKTLRDDEDLGLLPATGRTPGGHRLFAEPSLQRLRGELQGLLANWRSEPQPQDTVICPNLRV
jgi:hypothetical protein